jgi:hypothetical protein
MGTPTTFSHYRRITATLEKTELMVGKCANRIRLFPLNSIMSSGNRRPSPSGRWRVRRPALIRFSPSPTSN